VTYGSRQEIDLAGCLLIPGFVESHLHLDITLTNPWERPGRPEPFVSTQETNRTVEGLRKGFTREDIERRAAAALDTAVRHGVTALRAQCHVDSEVGLKHVEALQAVKERLEGKVTVQIVAFPEMGLQRDPGACDLIREAFRMGADVMGGAPNVDRMADGTVDVQGHINMALDLAMEADVDLDIHVDHELTQNAELDDLEVVHLAKRVIECGYQGRVAAGHVAALDSAVPDVRAKAIDLITEAGISVVCVPDLCRLGRNDVKHVRRGLPHVKELVAAGVNVACASNNVRDPWRPFGNFNLLEEALVLANGAHMDTVDELNAVLNMCTYNAAEALHLEGYGLDKDCHADMVVLEAPTPSAAIVGQAEKRYVFKDGHLLASNRVVSDLFS
jgi:cytosine deaminase